MHAGDIFSNTTDHLSWVYDGPGKKWVPLDAAAPVPTNTYLGQAGAGDPGTTGAAPKGPGDLYLDTTAASKTGTPLCIYEAATATTWNPTATIALKAGDSFFDIAGQDAYREK
jgi:hypothetical protein